jgi:hypothetical protein
MGTGRRVTVGGAAGAGGETTVAFGVLRVVAAGLAEAAFDGVAGGVVAGFFVAGGAGDLPADG